MKAIVLYSTKSGNTQKVAEEIASELNCESMRITKSNPTPNVDLSKYDLIVIGTGIHAGNPYDDIEAYLKGISLKNQNTFAFFLTWGGAGKTNQIVMAKIKAILESKNQIFVNDFYSCYGKWRFLKRGHPNSEELKASRVWIQKIVKNILK